MKKITFYILSFIVIPILASVVTTLVINKPTGAAVFGLATSRYEQNLLPFQTNAYDLGTSTNIWNRIFGRYASTTVLTNSGNTYLGTAQGNNPCSTFLVGTSTPDPGCAQMVISQINDVPSQSGSTYQALKFQVSNSTTFAPTLACSQFVWNIAFNSFAGAGRDMGAICANYDQAATSLGGRLRLYSRDHTSGVLVESLSIDGLHNVAIGTTTRMTPAQQPRFYVASANNNTTAPLFQFDFYNGTATTTRAVLTASGFLGIGTSTSFANMQVTTPTANATTTIEFGKPNQNKGTCVKLYDEIGTGYYLKVQTGGTLNLSANNCASVTGF